MFFVFERSDFFCLTLQKNIHTTPTFSMKEILKISVSFLEDLITKLLTSAITGRDGVQRNPRPCAWHCYAASSSERGTVSEISANYDTHSFLSGPHSILPDDAQLRTCIEPRTWPPIITSQRQRRT